MTPAPANCTPKFTSLTAQDPATAQARMHP
jgi:hypothetical protein